MSLLKYTFASTVRANKPLYRSLKPIADWYANLAGYRKHGLRYDDLIVEENSTVQRAIKRLPPQEEYDRAYRMKVAMQCSVLHVDLPQEQWLKKEDDVRYLTPLIAEIEKEDAERAFFDTAVVKK